MLRGILFGISCLKYLSGNGASHISFRLFFKNTGILTLSQALIISLNGIQLYRISKGEIFGELALVPNLKRTAIAVAREDSWIFEMNINHLESFGDEHPDVYQNINTNIVNSLGIKLARANKLIELLKSELAKNLRK